jgi:ribose transport system substrate-binding protein
MRNEIRPVMPDSPRYLVKSIVHASRVLSVFENPGEVLRLRDVVARSGFSKGLCFRLLYSLHHCGLLDKVGENQYRLVSDIRPRRRYRIGYGAQGQDSSFPREVYKGLVRAAERERVELLTVDNRYQAKAALRNAEQLIREGVDLVIEFQSTDSVAAAIAAKYMQAGIPLIAIDLPHPGATYFGANNYEAGLIAGRYLGKWSRKNWDGQVDQILILELDRAGFLAHARTRGVVAGLREVLRESEKIPVVAIDGDGQFKTSLEKARRHLRLSAARNVLVGAANDPSALGAARAFQEAGRASTCAIAGQNAEPDARVELRQKGTPLVASVGYFPEKYGDGLIRLALDILAKKAVPPAVFVEHQLITAANVDHYYPNDALIGEILPGKRLSSS